MKSQSAYKLAIDLVKNFIKYQNNIQKALRYREYSDIISYCFELIDNIQEDSSEAFINLRRIKTRVQVLTEMEYIKIKFATLQINIISQIEEDLLSHGKTA